MACVYFCYKLYVTVVKIHCTENKSETFSILIDIVNSINTPRNQYLSIKVLLVFYILPPNKKTPGQMVSWGCIEISMIG
jgi:hypothetical protein